AQVDARKAIALQPLAGRHAEKRRQLALTADHAEVAFGGLRVVIGGADGLGGRIDLPDEAAAVRGEVGAGGRLLGVAAGADERCADLHIPERRRLFGRGRLREHALSEQAQERCKNDTSTDHGDDERAMRMPPRAYLSALIRSLVRPASTD